MTKYIVLLKNKLPRYGDDRDDVHEGYAAMVGRMHAVRNGAKGMVAAVTEATTPLSAISHVVFRNFNGPNDRVDKRVPRMITSRIIESGWHEVYEFPTDMHYEKTGLPVDEHDRKLGEEGFLANRIAERRGLEYDSDAADVASELADLVQ